MRMVSGRWVECNARKRSGACSCGIGIINLMQKLTKITAYLLLGWGLWAISLSAQAVEVSGLYEAELTVMSQGRAERRQTIRSALLEVLIKVSGNTSIALSPGIPQVLSRSNQFLQQYRYRSEQQPVDPETGTALNQQYLWVRFDKKSIDTAMRKLELPIWGRSRPATIAWIAVEQDGQRQLLTSSESTKLTQAILEKAKHRGIPLDLPLFDLEDQKNIKVTDVLAGFQETILSASQRYSTDAVLVGRLRQLVSQRWQGRWTLNLAGREYNWTQQGDLDSVIGFGVDGVTSTLASNFVRAPSKQTGEVSVLVTDVLNLGDYARTDKFLAGLDGVIAVEPEKIESQSILFKLKLRGDQQSLLQAVRLSSQSVLAAVDTPPAIVITQPINNIAIVPSLTFKLIQ